jgi:hypothetical protein
LVEQEVRMAHHSGDPARRTPAYRDNTGTWVLGIMALFVAFGLALWGMTGDSLKTAMKPPVEDTNTGVAASSDPEPEWTAERP